MLPYYKINLYNLSIKNFTFPVHLGNPFSFITELESKKYTEQKIFHFPNIFKEHTMTIRKRKLLKIVVKKFYNAIFKVLIMSQGT